MHDASPNSSTSSLPDDPAALKALVTTLMRRADTLETSEQRLTARAQDLELRKLRLEMELLKHKKWMYGPRADKLATLRDVAQMVLAFGEALDARPRPGVDEAAALAAEDAKASGEATHAANESLTRRVKRGKGRRNLATCEHLPVRRHEHDLPEADKPCPCCWTRRAKIGEESSWQIEYVPGRFERLEHVRFKYACTHCEQNAAPNGPQIVRADKPIGISTRAWRARGCSRSS